MGFLTKKNRYIILNFHISVSVEQCFFLFVFHLSLSVSYLYNVFLQSELEKRHAEEIRKHQIKENQLKEALKNSTSEKVSPRSIFCQWLLYLSNTVNHV